MSVVRHSVTPTTETRTGLWTSRFTNGPHPRCLTWYGTSLIWVLLNFYSPEVALLYLNPRSSLPGIWLGLLWLVPWAMGDFLVLHCVECGCFLPAVKPAYRGPLLHRSGWSSPPVLRRHWHPGLQRNQLVAVSASGSAGHPAPLAWCHELLMLWIMKGFLGETEACPRGQSATLPQASGQG